MGYQYKTGAVSAVKSMYYATSRKMNGMRELVEEFQVDRLLKSATKKNICAYHLKKPPFILSTAGA